MKHTIWRMALLFTVLLGPAVGGCSWIFVDAPPAEVPEGQLPECTESRAAPIVDTVIASIGAAMVVAGVAVIAEETSADHELSGIIAVVAGIPLTAIGLVGLVPYAISAASGFEDTAACRDFLAGQDQFSTAAPPAEPPEPVSLNVLPPIPPTVVEPPPVEPEAEETTPAEGEDLSPSSWPL